jgi:molybdopterin/thiamine biosynthesis adenylyltransferase
MPDNESTLSRHARHLALKQVGAAGQERIGNGTALLIGVGGIGCPAASYLAASGVGHLVLCDFDTVDATNLGRQILYGPADIGKLKAEVAAERLAAINPDIEITSVNKRLDDEALAAYVGKADVVLDGSDNFATRFQVNDACVAASTCLISGAAIRLEGQLAEFGPDYSTSPCYRCLYKEADESLENCAGNGVLGPVPGAIGTLMAVEALKFLAGIESKRGVLRLFDATSGEFRAVKVAKRDDCPVCGETRRG